MEQLPKSIADGSSSRQLLTPITVPQSPVQKKDLLTVERPRGGQMDPP